MALQYINNGERWRGERIDGIAYPLSIETKWTEAELATIGLEKVPPPPAPEASTNPIDYPLQPLQFFAMLEIMGESMEPPRNLKDEISAAIDTIPDTAARAVARAKYQHTTAFHRDNPLFAQLAPTLGLTDAEIDAAWMQAKDIA